MKFIDLELNEIGIDRSERTMTANGVVVMKRVLLASFALVAPIAAQPASAADVAVPQYKVPPPAPVYSWSGFYVGAGAGGGGLVVRNVLQVPPINLPLDDNGGRGWFGSGIVGYDRQIDSGFVAGVFADFDWSSIKVDRFSFGGLGAVQQQASDKLQHNWSASAGVRAGVLVNPATLLFVSGGYTRAGFDNVTLAPSGGLSASFSIPRFDGWFAGAGLETYLTRNLLLRAEYRFAEFAHKSVAIPFVPGFFGVTGASFDMKPSLQTARLMLSYKFGWDVAVVAKD